MPTNGNRSHVRGALGKRACDFPLNWARLRQYLDTVAASGLGLARFSHRRLSAICRQLRRFRAGSGSCNFRFADNSGVEAFRPSTLIRCLLLTTLPLCPDTFMKSLLLLLAVTLTASAQTEKPLTSFPYTPGLDVTSMDKTADPCVDFYQYSCGGWMKNNPIPGDQARWSVYGKLYQDNQQFLWGILDQLSKQTSGRDANQQKIGDYFGACMDEGAINQLGAKPLQPYLDQIAALNSSKDL